MVGKPTEQIIAMRPRILLRTHYQVDEPRIIIAAVTACSSPIESRNESVIAASLKNAVLRWEHPFGLPAGMYAVDNARSLGFLGRSNRWAAPGLALAYLQQIGHMDSQEGRPFELSVPECKLYLRQYLTGAGALVIRFSRWLLECGVTTEEELGRQGIIEKLIAEVLNDYLSIVVEIHDRVAIRNERDRIRAIKYTALTRRHKRRPLLKTMQRLALIDVGSDGMIRPDPQGRLGLLCNRVPDVAALEHTVVLLDELTPLISAIYENSVATHEGGTVENHAQLARGYAYAMGLGLQACPLEYLHRILEAGTQRVTPGAADTILADLHRRYPREVRFHIDRKGKRAFVVLSEAARRVLESTPIL
jgi:hypothetical protein